MTSKFELANRVFWELGHEFVSTVFGVEPSGKTSVTCGILGGNEPLSHFHLDPFARGDCAGVDWIGTCVIFVLCVVRTKKLPNPIL